MKPREPRFKVMLPARLRWDGDWVTGSVRNVSAHGLMLNTGQVTPPVGSYVELLVGSETITARSVWTGQGECGLRTRSPINFQGLNESPSRSRRAADIAAFGNAVRQQPAHRDAREHAEKSRQLSYAVQYLTALIVAALVAGSIGYEVYHTLSAPLSSVSRAMSGVK